MKSIITLIAVLGFAAQAVADDYEITLLSVAKNRYAFYDGSASGSIVTKFCNRNVEHERVTLRQDGHTGATFIEFSNGSTCVIESIKFK